MVTLIFISGRGLAISSAQKRESRLYLFGKELISCSSRANVRAFHENSDRDKTLNSHLLTLKAHITKNRAFVLKYLKPLL